MTTLREEMTRDLVLKGYSPRTIEAYISHVKRFAIHYDKCPSELGGT